MSHSSGNLYFSHYVLLERFHFSPSYLRSSKLLGIQVFYVSQVTLTPVLLNQRANFWSVLCAVKAVITLHHGIAFLCASAQSAPHYTTEFIGPVNKSQVPAGGFSGSFQKLLSHLPPSISLLLGPGLAVASGAISVNFIFNVLLNSCLNTFCFWQIFNHLIQRFWTSVSC